MFVSVLPPEGPPGVSTKRNKETLLIVDDDPQVPRVLARLLSREFGKVLIAATPEEAEQILMAYRVTHLIADYDLGEGSPRGTELVTRWRRRYRSIRRALLFTGHPLCEIEIPAAVDQYFRKGGDPKPLLRALKR